MALLQGASIAENGHRIGSFSDDGYGWLASPGSISTDRREESRLNHLLGHLEVGLSFLPFQKIEARPPRKEDVILF